ncbi:hypothetical protein INS49_005800 [Diaporthe citri]|uniref:uncharacterized protein n=1 Tax=Diaporthe citri TaxID=83186 RepID=UPI001C804778|nr:uncharacterized protein INS49_005800 [Diaporthe citri]KAG6364202.1 hypothetical protein INS49_005800 [Diaporthe citri]
MVYRDLLGPKFKHDEIISVPLQRAQPAITRVNKQLRAESLSIYYAENSFWLEINLQEDYTSYMGTTGYFNFCHYVERFAPAQAQSRGIQNPLHHVRDVDAGIRVGPYTAFARCARFEKKPDRDFRGNTGWWGLTVGRLGGDEIDWADRTSVDALVKQWMDALPGSEEQDAQERLIHVLCQLGVNLRPDSTTLVSFGY